MGEPKRQDWGANPELFGPRHEYRLGFFLRETRALPAPTTILDAAVGFGQLASRLVGQGHRVIGLDTSFSAVLHAARVAGIPSVVGDLTRLPFPDRAFGAVTSGETLEHLDDDTRAVGEFCRVLQPSGRCVVTVPAMMALWSASDEFQDHRRRYEKRDLGALFRRAGFDIARLTFWGFPFVLLYDTLFILPMNRRRAKRAEANDSALRTVAKAGRARWLVQLVRATFSLDRMFGWLPFGPGLFLVARKR